MKRRTLILSSIAIALSACASFGGASKDIPAVASARPELSTFNSLVASAGLGDTLSGNGPYTVFAPTDEAFAAVPAKTLAELKADPARLKAVLSYHVVAGKLGSADIKPGELAAVSGDKLTVEKAGSFLGLNGVAVVTTPDVVASNGVIQVIDSVLLPPAKK
ncbi:fasciclin domain-containing protein [Derxia gummosa]|uniref:Fasciclin domain-containing protein n=1 Tax=Derxia gummosa DSM 723 TaxID=1121388 RepID=A0A8B6X5V5_9BURK|nr:fasciclin domain-containing protein [Derxia gummosa]